METNVFNSSIKRKTKPLQNDLYNLLNIELATPTRQIKEIEHPCNFVPNTGKLYEPKRRNKFVKVKTVRDVRKLFETDILTDLTKDLDKQQSLLLKKITAGSSRDTITKSLAKSIVKCEKPVSRATWQMLMTLNPEGHSHAIQYALWNGKLIRISGSRGGKNKFIYNYDLAHRKVKKREIRIIPKKTSLLNNSISVKFKPGPLCKKHVLDESYQKYNVGITKSIELPKPGLDIHPKYGVTLEPRISNFIQNLRDPQGFISEKWAEFAVSVLGTNKDSVPIQCDKDSGVTFELNYRCKQQRLLMRCHESERTIDKPSFLKNKSLIKSQENLNAEVKTILNEMIDSVDISLQQDNMYTGEDEPRGSLICENMTHASMVSKDKPKKRYGELDRLDVTIIRLPETSKSENDIECNNAHCSLGCICASLRCEYNFKRHCGKIECMFECKCDFTKYKALHSFDNDCPELIPGLINLDNELSFKLAKEEQKFHQTVVVTGEKSILLKPERRNWKTSKRYGDYFNNMSLKNDVKSKQSLSVISTKLNCKNIEPWCMVHNLYKCFCKGIFTFGLDSNVLIEKELNKAIDNKDESTLAENSMNENSNTNSSSRYESKRIRKPTIEHQEFMMEMRFREGIDENSTCARLNPFKKRNYFSKYYKTMHQKILEMEKNDDSLRKKLAAIVNNFYNDNHDVSQDINQNNDMTQTSKPESETNSSSEIELVKENSLSPTPHKFTINDPSLNKSVIDTVSNKTKLIAWLESSYKAYKERESNKGLKGKQSLDPPKHGKVALYPWEFILSRYRERKNLFLVSKRQPYRIFMCIDAKHSFFENCMNIDDIRFNDLSKYPVTVKNLLTNATYLKDNFCILCGLSICWELIGSVTKVPDPVNNKKQVEETENDQRLIYDNEDESCRNSPATVKANAEKLEDQVHHDDNVIQELVNENPEISRWFIMTIENDFSEIQFHNKGFFVKYESIIKALNVARLSGKTVRLSSQKTFDDSNDPQFGLYAIPNANEYYVLVGPYERDEPLGIETVKSISDVMKPKKTRGVWIQTKKVDNIKILDNPLSFIPFRDSESSANLTEIPSQNISKSTIENNSPVTPEISKVSTDAGCSKDSVSNAVKKVVKPIKIRKTNGFYHLTSKNNKPQIEQLNQIQNKPLFSLLKSAIPIETVKKKGPPSLLVVPLTTNSGNNTIKTPVDCPVENSMADADSISQIKIVNVYSEKDETVKHTTVTKKPERGMLILKPEEINKRLMEHKLMPSAVASHLCDSSSSESEINQDIKKFLDVPTYLEPMNIDPVVLSDDDDTSCKYYPSVNADVMDIWIECINNDHLGWIAGKKNSNNEISFEFPGFLFTDFYDKEEAFSKINQVLSRKIYVPKNIHLEWCIVECEENLKIKHKLKSTDLGSDFVLTKKGLRHRSDVIGFSNNFKSNNASVSDMAPEFASAFMFTEMDKAIDMMSDFEEQSKTLDDENDMLINQLRSGGKLLGTITSVSDNERELISQTLQTFINDRTQSKDDGKQHKAISLDTDTDQ